MISSSIDTCRICGSKALIEILNLGNQPPANSLRSSISEELDRVPLVICRCSKCTTVQLTEDVSPDYLFTQYVWVTGTSSTAREYAKTFYQRACDKVSTKPGLVIEIASNDGTFLAEFSRNGYQVLGIDPAKNLAELANRSGIPTLPAFFSLDLSHNVVESKGLADIVIARNVLPHVPDPNDFVAGIEHCLSDRGIGIIEFHWSQKIVEELHYDSIYHEHYFYHTLHSVKYLLDQYNLTVFDVEFSPISGGSLVVFFSKEKRSPSKQFQDLMRVEDEQGLFSLETWQKFALEVGLHRSKLKHMVDHELKEGKRLIGYGASARSSTLLNFCEINNQQLLCVADQNPLKHERFTPGTNIQILSPEAALAMRPDTVLLLGWNFRDEIMADLARLGFKGNVIMPLPMSPSLTGFNQ
jgi:SAM-dependent methyltransferase